MRVEAIIPFFGGTSSATHSKTDTRLDYLARTIASLDALGWRHVVFQSTRDKVDVPGSTRLDIDPIWLPYAACVDAQLGQHFWKSPFCYTEHVYVTEADQVVHLADEGVFDFCTDTQYVAPWRLDLAGPDGETENQGEDAATYILDGVTYGISNGVSNLQAASKDDPQGVIPVRSAQGSFSGAFLCSVDYFRAIRFRRMRNLPVEHATGLDAKSAGECVKTVSVPRFYVDHLSPRDRWATEKEGDE